MKWKWRWIDVSRFSLCRRKKTTMHRHVTRNNACNKTRRASHYFNMWIFGRNEWQINWLVEISAIREFIFYALWELSDGMTYSFCTCTSWSESRPWCPRGMLCSKTTLWNVVWVFWFFFFFNNTFLFFFILRRLDDCTDLLTSSADWAMKNPWVLAAILAPRGLIEILLSLPPSPFISMASRRSFSFVKHNLRQAPH